MKIFQDPWIVASLANGRFEVYREGVLQTGKNPGKPYKKDRKEIQNLIGVLDFLQHQRIHHAEIETWEQLREEIMEFRGELTMLTEFRMRLEP